MKHFLFILSRLWRYNCLYFLKPHDSINDTLTSSLLRKLDWTGSIIEIGSGDGVFSYIMHGGSFPFWFDRYLQVDMSKADIYDIHHKNLLKPKKTLKSPNVILAIDAKESHVQKIKEIDFAKDCQVSAYEELPFASGSVEKIFYYTPHGLKNHDEAIQEASRVLKRNGRMLILVYDSLFKKSFISYRLAKFFSGSLATFFSKLDNGRYDEITCLARSPGDWEIFFRNHGFEVEARHSGLSTFAWKAYDLQTRPILKPLIRIFDGLPRPLRVICKLIWVMLTYPYIVIFYFLFSNEYLMIDKKNCYLAYQVIKK